MKWTRNWRKLRENGSSSVEVEQLPNSDPLEVNNKTTDEEEGKLNLSDV